MGVLEFGASGGAGKEKGWPHDVRPEAAEILVDDNSVRGVASSGNRDARIHDLKRIREKEEDRKLSEFCRRYLDHYGIFKNGKEEGRQPERKGSVLRFDASGGTGKRRPRDMVAVPADGGLDAATPPAAPKLHDFKRIREKEEDRRLFEFCRAYLDHFKIFKD